MIFQFIPWTFLKLITTIRCFMLSFGLHRKLNVSRLLKPCSRWGSNSQPRHCSAAYCLISTAHWPIAPLELLTQKHFTKHYGLCVVIFQCIPWNFLKMITAIWCFMLGFGLHRKLNLSPSKTLLQVRLELTTSALHCCVLSYKHRALTDCPTGAVDSKAFYKTLWSLRSNLSIYSMNFPQTDYIIWYPKDLLC